VVLEQQVPHRDQLGCQLSNRQTNSTELHRSKCQASLTADLSALISTHQIVQSLGFAVALKTWGTKAVREYRSLTWLRVGDT
jgi:hypothetical protein